MSMYDDTVDVTPEGVSEGAALSEMFGESAPVETERGIEAITEEIIFYKNVGGQAVIEIGRRLTEAKAQLKHGEWLPWLREKVEFRRPLHRTSCALRGSTEIPIWLGIWEPRKPWYYWLCRHLSERISRAKNTL